MSTKNNLELENLFIRNLNFKDSGGYPIPANKILFSRGDGGTFFGDLPLPCLSSVLRAFNEVRAGSNITLSASNSYNRLWFEPGAGIDFYKQTEAGQDKIYIYAQAPESIEVVGNGSGTLNFRDIPIGPDGKVMKYAAIGDIAINVSSDTVFFQTQFNSSYAILASTLSTTMGLQEQQEVMMAQQSTLTSQLNSTIANVDILLTSTGTAALASTITDVDQTVQYMSTFLFRDNFQFVNYSTGEYILRVSSFETQAFRAGEYNVGSNTLTDLTLTPEGGRNFDVYVGNGTVSTLTNYFFLTDSYSEQQYTVKKEKLYSISTVGPVVYTTYGANIETGWVPNISTLGDPFNPSIRDQFYPVIQQTQIWEQLSTSSGNLTINYILRNTGRFDTICAPATLNINTSSLYVSSIRQDLNFSTGYLTYNTSTNEITYNPIGSIGLGSTGPTGADGMDGATGATGEAGEAGATGAAGPTGPTGIPGTATNTGATGEPGDRYNTQTVYPQAVNPFSGAISLFVETKLAYIVGNAVLVVQSTDTNTFFTGIVQSYNVLTGQIDINQISDITGSFGGSENYNVNLNGISGPTGNTGPTGPTGLAERYNTRTTGSETIDPSSPPVLLTVESGLAYVAGNAILVLDSTNPSNRFEGQVLSYNSATGAMQVDAISNIQGSFGSPKVYTVSLNGTLGPTGLTGPTGLGATGARGATGPTGAVGATGATGAVGATGATGARAAFTTFYPYTPAVGTVAYAGIDTVIFTQTSVSAPGFLTTSVAGAGNGFSFTFTIPSFSFSQLYIGLRYTTASYTSLMILQRSTATTGTIYWKNGATLVGSYTVGDTLTWVYDGTGSGTNLYLFQNGIEVSTDSIGINNYYFEVWMNAVIAGYPQTITVPNLRFVSGGSFGPTGATGAGVAGATGPTGYAGPTGWTGPAGQGGTGATGPAGTNGYTGPTGPGNMIYNDDWIQYYMIDPPPYVVMQSTSSASTEIYVPWTYPTQIPIGLVDYWIPHINTFNAFFDAQLTTGPYRVSLLSNISTSYVNNHNSTAYTTGIVLSKVAGTSGLQTRLFPGESTSRLVYVYYDTNLANLVADSSTNKVSVWYMNNNPQRNIASTFYSPFVSAGPPSIPQSLTASAITCNSLTFGYSPPAQVDITDASSSATIVDYRIGYTITPIPGRRYGPPLYASTTGISVGNVLSYAASGLYPDSFNEFTVAARNSVFSGYGQTASTTRNTLSLGQSAPLTGNLSFPSRYYTNGTIRNARTGTATTTLVNLSTAWTSDLFRHPIHNSTVRGTTSTNLASLLVSMAGALNVVGPSISYNGFPAVSPATTSANNLTLSTFVYDKYSTPVSFTGFYLDAQTRTTIDPALFVPSSATYTLTAAQSVANLGSATHQYQFDNIITAAPGISLLSTNIMSNSYMAITGVNVLYGSPVFGVSSIVSNVGNFFYRSPFLSTTVVAGTVRTNASELGLANITSGYNSGIGQLSNTLTVQTAITSASLATAYASSITASSVAANPLTGSAVANANSIVAIVDGPSATLVGSTIPASPVAFTSGTSRVGARIYGGISQGGSSNPSVPPFLYTGGSYSSAQYATIPYSHTWDITNSTISGIVPNTIEELQIFNGKHRTRANTTTGYYDYRRFYYTPALQNAVNYSAVASTGYRYATFAWSVSTITGTPQYSALNFVLNAVSPTPTITSGSAYVAGQKLELWYRFEDSASPTPTTADSLSSIWLDANGQGATVTSGNFFNPTDNSATRPGLIADPVNSGGNTTFTVAVPKPFQSGAGTVYIYLRVGLPMSTNFEFSHASGTLTAS